jgi:hypothetical protein
MKLSGFPHIRRPGAGKVKCDSALRKQCAAISAKHVEKLFWPLENQDDLLCAVWIGAGAPP